MTLYVRIKRSRYDVKRVYIVVCKDCNEDIGRPVSGEECETREQVDELLREHDETWHGSEWT